MSDTWPSTSPHAVPAGGEVRLRIFKTYEDPASYTFEGDTIVFDRGLGIRANAVVLPPGYELVGSATPGMVSTLSDGRVKVSFVPPGEATADLLEKLAFRRHRRQVAGVRQPRRTGTESGITRILR